MHMTSTNTRLFALTAGKVSAGLARGRLWQVKDGIARLRLLVHDEIQGEIEVPESGWFVVPESEMLQIQLVALSDITFESRLPINLIPRLGDLGRQQLIYPIREILRAICVDDSMIDWTIKLSQPGFKSWLNESLDEAIRHNQPMSPDIVMPLITNQAPRTIIEKSVDVPVFGNLAIHILAGTLAILSVVKFLLILVLLNSPAFALSSDYPISLICAVFWIVFSSVGIYLLNQCNENTPIVTFASGLSACLVSLMWVKPTLALAFLFSISLIGSAYWIYVKRLLSDLPHIDKPLRWLFLRLSRDGMPSMRSRIINVWEQARRWVISRIELIAEFSRFSRAVISGSLVILGIAMAESSNQIVSTGLCLLTLVILDRLRSALPVSVDVPNYQESYYATDHLSLSGDIQYDGIVFRRHAGDRPLFDHLYFQCKSNSLIRITAAEGSGLSTLKSMLIRKVIPERGTIRIGGMDIARISSELLAYSIVMLDHPDDEFVETVADWLFIESGIQASTLEHHLTGMRAGHWIERLPNRLESPVGALRTLAGPHGLNRLKLARALSRNGQIVWLDHWLIGLTMETREHVIRSLTDRAGTRFVVDRNGLLSGREHVHWDIS